MNEAILMIETSTDKCSAAVFDGEKITASKSTDQPRMQAAMLAPFVQQVLDESGISAQDLAAVAVSEGPGSYTGLRVGVSTAKGICFGAKKPLIAVDTLEIIAIQGMLSGQYDKIIAMIDARRMEVYAAVFDSSARKVSETKAVILDESSFSEELAEGRILFIGTGVEKFRTICNNTNATFLTISPSAENMARPASERLKKEEFKDVAYFEPFYLKEFVAGISKKSVL